VSISSSAGYLEGFKYSLKLGQQVSGQIFKRDEEIK